MRTQNHIIRIKPLLTTALVLLVLPFFSQQKKLDKAVFQSSLINQWWSSENNKETKGECDMRIFVIKQEGFELNCVNWTNGFSGNKCGFDVKFNANFFELKAKNCQNNVNPGYVYGYLNESDKLFLVMSKKPLPLNQTLLAEKDWIGFEKIKR